MDQSPQHQPRFHRGALKLPKQNPSPEPFARLCAPLVGKRVVLTHKSWVLFFGVLESADGGVLRLIEASIKSKDRQISRIECVVININVLSHIHEDKGQYKDQPAEGGA